MSDHPLEFHATIFSNAVSFDSAPLADAVLRRRSRYIHIVSGRERLSDFICWVADERTPSRKAESQ